MFRRACGEHESLKRACGLRAKEAGVLASTEKGCTQVCWLESVGGDYVTLMAMIIVLGLRAITGNGLL